MHSGGRRGSLAGSAGLPAGAPRSRILRVDLRRELRGPPDRVLRKASHRPGATGGRRRGRHPPRVPPHHRDGQGEPRAPGPGTVPPALRPGGREPGVVPVLLLLVVGAGALAQDLPKDPDRSARVGWPLFTGPVTESAGETVVNFPERRRYVRTQLPQTTITSSVSRYISHRDPKKQRSVPRPKTTQFTHAADSKTPTNHAPLADGEIDRILPDTRVPEGTDVCAWRQPTEASATKDHNFFSCCS